MYVCGVCNCGYEKILRPPRKFPDIAICLQQNGGFPVAHLLPGFFVRALQQKQKQNNVHKNEKCKQTLCCFCFCLQTRITLTQRLSSEARTEDTQITASPSLTYLESVSYKPLLVLLVLLVFTLWVVDIVIAIALQCSGQSR